MTAIFILFTPWLLTTLLAHSSDLQTSTAILNQLPGQLVSIQIRIYRVKIHYSIDSSQHIDCINS